MRAYTVATVAVSLGVPPKWLDNALTRFEVRGVVQSRQGISRRLAPQAVVTLYLANEFVRVLEMPLGAAISMAERAGEEPGTTLEIDLFTSVRVTIDVPSVAREVGERLARAVEVTPVPKRGRPSNR